MMDNKKFLHLFSKIGLLKTVPRTGWVLKGVKNAESVADHTWRVVMLALILGPRLGINQTKLIKMALIHDLGEIDIGDIKWETGKKVIGSQEQKHRDERATIQNIFDLENNDNFQDLVDLWEEFVSQKTKEARVLKQLDKLEMALQALEYEAAGYPSGWFDEFWENAEKYIAGGELEPYFRFLQQERRKLK